MGFFTKTLPEIALSLSSRINDNFQILKGRKFILNGYTAISFLVEIQEFAELAKFIRARFHELSGSQYHTLRPAANLLQNIDPIAATLIYRKMIEPILNGSKYKYYDYAAQDLVTCGVLNAHITHWGPVQNHAEYLTVIETQHKRKFNFWSNYHLAVQKQATKVVKTAKSSL